MKAGTPLRRWGWVVLFLIYLWGSVPFLRPVAEFLRENHLLRLSLWTLAVGLGILVGWVWIWRFRTFSWRRFALLLGAVVLYLGVMTFYVVAPEERLHYLQSGILVFLVYRALRKEGIRSRALPWVAGALGAIAMAIEEAIQLKVPGRYFDWRDMDKGVIGSFLAAGILKFVLEKRGADDAKSPTP